ncbi:MAG: DUF721 domain-containing protein [Verrucomicrobia bacterium]|nr:DUF721 domain-containing protein [Verrucomicrobiota bacterium]
MIKRPFQYVPAKGPPKASARQRAIAQLRGGWNPEAREIAMKISGKPVSELLPRVLKQIRFDQRQGEAEIVKIWNASIDPVVAAHAQPHGIARGTLFITVDSNAWLSEIVQWRRKEILSRMQAALGSDKIKKLSFRVG